MANLNNRKTLRPSELGDNSSHGCLHSNDMVHIRDVSLPQRSKSPSPMTGLAVKRISDSHLDYATKGDNEENVCGSIEFADRSCLSKTS